MTTFKTFLRIVQKNIWVIVMYTVILVIFSTANVVGGNKPVDFAASKPDIVVYDKDESEISKSLVKYLGERATINEIVDENDNVSDALYYNSVDYIIYLEKGFGEKIAQGEDFEVEVKSVENYDAFLSKTILNRYIKIAKGFAGFSEKDIVTKTEEIVKNKAEVSLNSELNVEGLTNAAFYYNFLNYSILAGLVFAVAYATIGFRRRMVKKRITASATNYRKINFDLLLCSFLLSFILWIIYNVLGIILIGTDIVFTTNGLMMVGNSLILTIFAVVFALFITNLVEKTGALNVVVNIISLGSSFLCGVFIPAEWMPEFVLNLARIFPSYYYIDSNRKIAELEKFDGEHLQPIIINALIILGVTAIIAIVNNIISRKKRKE